MGLFVLLLAVTTSVIEGRNHVRGSHVAKKNERERRVLQMKMDDAPQDQDIAAKENKDDAAKAGKDDAAKAGKDDDAAKADDIAKKIENGKIMVAAKKNDTPKRQGGLFGKVKPGEKSKGPSEKSKTPSKSAADDSKSVSGSKSSTSKSKSADSKSKSDSNKMAPAGKNVDKVKGDAKKTAEKIKNGFFIAKQKEKDAPKKKDEPKGAQPLGGPGLFVAKQQEKDAPKKMDEPKGAQ